MILVLVGTATADIDSFRSAWWILFAFVTAAAVLTTGLGPPRVTSNKPLVSTRLER